MGKGENSFLITLLRTIILQISLAYILAFVLDFGFTGVIAGIVAGNIMTGFIAFGWGTRTVRGLKRALAHDVQIAVEG